MRSSRLILALIVLVYIGLALGVSLTKAPFCDEGWLASPGLNLLRHGTLETSLIEPRGSFLKSIDHYTYWVMPLWLLMLSVWYKAFGFGLTTMRSLSTFWGGIGIASCFAFTRRLTEHSWTAILACLILAADTNFIINGGTGRMDMMAAVCGFGGVTAYLILRERKFSWAVGLSHALVAAGVLCHPNGIINFLVLCFMSLYLDRDRIRWVDVALAATPYVCGLALWGLYLSHDPQAFVAQFVGNAKPGERGLIFHAPVQALRLELEARYLTAYGFYTEGLKRLRVLPLILYAAALIGSLLTHYIRRDRFLHLATMLVLVSCAGLLLVDGIKRSFYLPYVLPYLAVLSAIWINWLWDRQRTARIAIGIAIAAVIIVQVGGAVSLISNKNRQRFFEPVIAFLRQNNSGRKTIDGPSELGFGLGYNPPLVDDYRLGFYSGKRPQFIVVDDNYRSFFDSLKDHDRPAYDYVRHLIDQDYKVVYQNGLYSIYERRPAIS